MPRTARPWWRSQKRVWCVTVDGKRKTLGPHPADAPAPKYNKRKDAWNVPEAVEDAWKRMQRGEAPVVSPDTCWAVLEAFLEWTEKNRSPGTYDWYVDRLQRFKDGVPNAPVETLKAHTIQTWLDKQRWGVNYKRGMVTAIRRVFNWAIKQELVGRNPAAGVERPAAAHREQLISPVQFQEILKLTAGDDFRELLKFVWYSGCRPQEVARIEARHLKDGYIEFAKAESKGKRTERQIFLNDMALKIARKAAKKHPQGPIFRNSHGKPWNAGGFNNHFTAIQVAFGRQELAKQGFEPTAKQVAAKIETLSLTMIEHGVIRNKTAAELRAEAKRKLIAKEAKKHSEKVCMYALRHSFAHHAITRGGLSLEETATLLGHSSTTMVYKIYGKLKKNKAFMREAAKRAVTRER